MRGSERIIPVKRKREGRTRRGRMEGGEEKQEKKVGRTTAEGLTDGSAVKGRRDSGREE